jgi:hypothetical protein
VRVVVVASTHQLPRPVWVSPSVEGLDKTRVNTFKAKEIEKKIRATRLGQTTTTWSEHEARGAAAVVRHAVGEHGYAAVSSYLSSLRAALK